MKSFAVLALAVILAPSALAQHQTFAVNPDTSEVKMKLNTTHEVVNGTFHVQSGSIEFDRSATKISGSVVEKIHRATGVRRQTNRALLAGLALAIAFVIGYRVPAGATEARVGILELDPSKTMVEFKLEGSLHTTHGTFRLKRGTIKANGATGDAQGEVVIDAASGQSGDLLRDNRMRDSVLEAARWPDVTFAARHLDGHLDAKGDFHANLRGVLTLHGAQHDAVIQTQGRLEGNYLIATGRLSIPYVRWGLKDPSILFFDRGQGSPDQYRNCRPRHLDGQCARRDTGARVAGCVS